MDQFIVSARKYRPDTFDSVVGQGHITNTLKNAIKSSHLAQAFLFSGPRGVGKTTCARILAKTVNCFNRSEEIEACNECESCESFNDGHSLNIYELDAASNNGVEDIRKLIDQVRFAPQLGNKKVYIIDEVHMLSPAAFNAFLKTLEEPPSHAMFILATTEKHKIIPTVLSRCQIFDFNRIDNLDMVRSLDEIAKKESVTAEHDALHLIAQKSEGSLRDALSMFDQMVTYSGNNLTYESVVENLSILGTDYFFDTTDYLVSGDVFSALNLFDGILKKGFDGHNFILGLAEHMRNLLVVQDHRTLDLLNAGPQIKDKYAAQTLKVSAGFLLKSLNLLSKADLSYKSAKNQRLLVEICLINLANLSVKVEGNSNISNSIPTTQPEVKKKAVEIEAKGIEPKADSKEEVKIQEPISPVKVKSKEIEPSIEKEIISEKARDIEKVEEEVKKVVQKKEVVKEESIIESDVQGEDQKELVKSQISEPIPSKIEPSVDTQKQGSTEIITDSLSISAFTDIEEEESSEEEDDVETVRFSEAVDSEALKASWKKLADSYNQQGRINLFATLSRYEPNLVDDNHIEIKYDNKSQSEAISKEKMNILDFMRQDLKNDLLQLKLTISDKVQVKAYTDSEKLEKMIEKNPDINLLKDQLDLDIN